MLVRVFLESGAFPLGFGGPFRTGRVASSAELHGPREPTARLPAPFEVLTGLKEERNDAGKACTACMIHLQATSRMSAEPRCIRTEGPREYVEPSGSILWGGQAAPKTPTLDSPPWEEVLPACARRLQPKSGRQITH